MSRNTSSLHPLLAAEKGTSYKVAPGCEQPQLQYASSGGTLSCGDSLSWLRQLESESVDLIVADPPYNIKKADWDNFESQSAYVDWSMQWIEAASRTLKKTGSIYICGFSEILADLKLPASRYFARCKWIVWHYKNKANLGKDWGRSHESILHFRKSDSFRLNIDRVRIPYGRHTLKYPSHPQAKSSAYGGGKKRDNWVPHPGGAKPKDVLEIPTTCNGMGEKTKHPTQKPEELIRRLVLAASYPGDFVIDPFSGSGTTVVVAEQLGRQWGGCDLSAEYNSWAIDRLESVRRLTESQWIKHDRQVASRREGIR